MIRLLEVMEAAGQRFCQGQGPSRQKGDARRSRYQWKAAELRPQGRAGSFSECVRWLVREQRRVAGPLRDPCSAPERQKADG